MGGYLCYSSLLILELVFKNDAIWRFFGNNFAVLARNPGKVMINLIPVRSPILRR